MTEGDRRTFAEGLISLGNLSMGAGVLTQLIPTKETVLSPLSLVFGFSVFLFCYWIALQILQLKGGGR